MKEKEKRKEVWGKGEEEEIRGGPKKEGKKEVQRREKRRGEKKRVYRKKIGLCYGFNPWLDLTASPPLTHICTNQEIFAKQFIKNKPFIKNPDKISQSVNN